jgi:hypothetical protein
MAQRFTLSGLLTAEPSKCDGALTDRFDLGFERTYPASDYGNITLDAVSTPFVLGDGVMQTINLLGLRVQSGGPILVLVTSSSGDSQAFSVSSVLILHCPNPATALSSVQLLGQAELSYAVAGTGVASAPGPAPPSPLDVEYDCDPSVQVRDAVYVEAANLVNRASAATTTESPAIGFVVSKITSTKCVVRRDSELGGFTGLTAASPYYLDLAAGQIADTPPTPPGAAVFQRVGFAKSASVLSIEVDQDRISLT